MKGKILWLMLSCALVFAMLLASCSTSTPSTTTAKTTTTAPVTTQTTVPVTKTTTTATTKPTTATSGNWWDKWGEPQYGGTLTIRIGKDPIWWDSYGYTVSIPRLEGDPKNYYLELLTMNNATLDPKVWDYSTNFHPVEYKVGCLAESFEQPDLETVVFHIRKGIKWQDKAPVNGRELTAYDIEYTWQRYLGLGSGFSKSSIYAGASQFTQIKSVTATDKYTVVYKMKEPALQMFLALTDNTYGHIVPREVIEKYGASNNGMMTWQNAVGTGPFMVEDYVSGSSVRLPKNPTYWGYDERYPKNQLPYVDEIKMVIIPDLATALAGMRSGKIDVLDNIVWDQALNLKKTNPEIQQDSLITKGLSPLFKYGVKPFDDIKVRQAMQMSIDLPTIAKTYFAGMVEGIPYPSFAPSIKGYSTPYEKWPQEVKDTYAYNPTGAKKLLADAGYPKGFKTNLLAPTTDDMGLLQILKAYLLDIGIDMEIKAMDPTAFANVTKSFSYDQMLTSTTNVSTAYPPHMMVTRWYTGHSTNYGQVADATYKAMVDKAMAATTNEEYKKLIITATDYVAQQHWGIVLPPLFEFNNYQPWVKGGAIKEYSKQSYHFSRCWIDQKIKKSMGR